MSESALPIPEFADLSVSARNKLLPGLQVTELRAAVLAEPRMHRFLTNSLMANAGEDLALSPDHQSLVETLLSQKRDVLHLQLGATYYANHLSVAVAKRQLKANSEDLTREAIRVALRHRNLALPMEVDDALPTMEKMRTEGELCLWTWVETLPKDCAEVLKLRFDPPAVAAKPASITRRKRIVIKILTSLASDAQSAGAA